MMKRKKKTYLQLHIYSQHDANQSLPITEADPFCITYDDLKSTVGVTVLLAEDR